MLFLGIGITFFILACSPNTQSSSIECIDTFSDCDSIYSLDHIYKYPDNNLLFSRWKIRKGEYKEAIEILDSLESIYTVNKDKEKYKEVIFYKYLTLNILYQLEIDNIDQQLELDLDQVHNINMLDLKSQCLRQKQEINYSYTTSLYSEYLRTKVSKRKKDQVYYQAFTNHAINLIREHADTPVSKYYLKKSLEKCDQVTPSCRWMKTLLLTIGESLNEEKIESIKKEVLKSNQYSPVTDKRINTHLNFIASDKEFAIKNLIAEIDTSKSIGSPPNLFNTTYLIDAYLDDDLITEAEYWLNQLLATPLTNKSHYNYVSFRNQKFLHKKYINSKSKENLIELYKCSTDLIESYEKQGKSILNEHYADAIYLSNNILIEAIYELSKKDVISNSQILNDLNNIKNLYNKISDSRSVLGNKVPSSETLQKINNLKHEIEILELRVNRYQDTSYTDLSIFKDLYFLHQELYDLKQDLPESDPSLNIQQENNIKLSDLDSNTQIIDFIETSNSTFLSRITSSEIKIVKLDKKLTHKAIADKKAQLLKPTKALGYNYLDSIIGELILEDYKDLVFIPDGKLFDFPIETIRDDSGNYILNKYTISYRAQISDAIQADSLRLNSSVFIGGYTSKETRNDRSSLSYPELHFGLQETDSLSSLYPNALSLTGSDFTEENLSKGTNNEIVHFSSHSSTSIENPLANYILARDKTGKGVPIYGFTLKSMDWNAKLVVLSSCESGTGTIKLGAGVFSLSRDFIQSGAQTVIKSLWKVNDRSTKELMLHFYNYFNEGLSVSEALVQAKIKIQEDARYKHPYYWAGFILEGNPNLFLNYDDY